MSTIKKRLHVSGLTPAITVTDINARLHGFGKVLALDGFGTLNAVGEPRKFAYVTLEATETNLARCLNVLSGTTWKGAKLRIGEAKPDYAQRLEAERKWVAEYAEDLPNKRRRLPRGVQGVHAKDMTTVNLKNADLHEGWHKTALCHLIRPMKMRPSRPLPEPITGQRPGTQKGKRKKPSSLNVPSRARVRAIDPRLFGPMHLRENMLEAVVIDSQATLLKMRSSPSPSSSSPDTPTMPKAAARPVMDSLPASAVEYVDVAELNIALEKARDLDLLTKMFGDDQSDWGGKESIDDAVDSRGAMSDVVTEAKVSATTEPDLESGLATSAPLEKPKFRSLKDMFQPHVEEAGFSLLAGLGDLDLDLELELDPAFNLDTPATSISAPVVPTLPVQASQLSGSLTLDPSLPLFFPQLDNPRAKDLFALARTEGWEFSRSGDSEAIRKRWDETKGSLTREWKKRARDAVKSRRRRYGAAEGEDV